MADRDMISVVPRLARSGVQIHYATRGPASAERWPVLLLMGLGFDAGAWDPVASILERRWRLIVTDPRGMGRSSVPSDRDFGPQAQAEDALAIVDATGAETAHVVGLSLGAAVAQELALMAPKRCASLSLLAGTAAFEASGLGKVLVAMLRLAKRLPAFDDATLKGQLADAWLPDLCGPGDGEPARQRLREGFERSFHATLDPRVLIAQLEALRSFDTRGRLDAIDRPALVLAAEHDPLVAPALSRQLAHGLPRGRLRVIAGTGHGMVLCRPREVAAALDGFMAEHDPAG